jgi:hypothetical protein
MAVGVMLLIIWLILGVGLTGEAVGGRGFGWLGRLGFGAAAGCSWLLLWWSGRFWYAAFCEGRRDEPVGEPSPWPWGLPLVVIGIAGVVTGVRQLGRGDSSGWFSLGFGLAFGLLGFLLLVLLMWAERVTRSVPTPVQTAEPPRPQRNWGPVGR